MANETEETPLDIVMASYRDMFGRTEKGNQIHRAACEEVWEMATEIDALKELINGLTADGWMQSAEGGAYCIGCGNEETQGHEAGCKYVAAMGK